MIDHVKEYLRDIEQARDHCLNLANTCEKNCFFIEQKHLMDKYILLSNICIGLSSAIEQNKNQL